MVTPALSLRHVSAFAADVRESLTKPAQRELPSKYLYDEVVSALFETICVLPEYGLTRGCWKSMRVKLWADCLCQFKWRSWAAVRGKRRGGSWKRSRDGKKHIIIPSRFRLQRWRR